MDRIDMQGHWAIKGGDATQGPLKTYWDGRRAPGYAPMKKQGAIILGIGKQSIESTPAQRSTAGTCLGWLVGSSYTSYTSYTILNCTH